MKNSKLEMTEWLHEVCPSVLPYLAFAGAVKTGNLRLLEWLSKRHESVALLPQILVAAASTNPSSLAVL